MKKLFTLSLLTLSILSYAQDDPFTLSVFGDDYNQLEGSTSLNNGQVWDDPSYTIPIGFDFYLFGEQMDHIILSDFGLGGMLTNPVTSDNIQIIIAYGSDIIDPGYYQDSSQANISYVTEGNFPTRIFKLEWDNCAFYEELADFGTSGNRVSFQLWLYEGTYDIELRFGPNSIKTPEVVHSDFNGAPWSAIVHNFNLWEENFEGFWFPSAQGEGLELASVESIDDIGSIPFYANDPSNGMVVRFATGFVGIDDEIATAATEVYPSVTRDQTFIKSIKDSNYRLHNISGSIVDEGRVQAGVQPLSMSEYPAGLYILQIYDGEKTESFRLIKQ